MLENFVRDTILRPDFKVTSNISFSSFIILSSYPDSVKKSSTFFQVFRLFFRGQRGFIQVCSLVGGQMQPIGCWCLTLRQSCSSTLRRNSLSAARPGQSGSEQVLPGRRVHFGHGELLIVLHPLQLLQNARHTDLAYQ